MFYTETWFLRADTNLHFTVKPEIMQLINPFSATFSPSLLCLKHRYRATPAGRWWNCSDSCFVLVDCKLKWHSRSSRAEKVTWSAGLHHVYAHLASRFCCKHGVFSLMGHVEVPVGDAGGGWGPWQERFPPRCSFQPKPVPWKTHLLTHQLSDQQTTSLMQTHKEMSKPTD